MGAVGGGPPPPGGPGGWSLQGPEKPKEGIWVKVLPPGLCT